MFLPISDSPNPSITPWVTRFLVVANVAIYVLVSLPLNRGLTREDLRDPAVAQTVIEMWSLQAEQMQIPAVSVDPTWLNSLSRYDVFVFDWGYQPGRASLLDLLVCMFLHGGLLHLAGNMLFLWIFGDNVEDRLGRVGYLLAYLFTGACATWFFAAFEPDSLIPLLGASGAISGVLGFYLIWFPHNRVNVFVFLGFWFMDVIPVRAFWVLLFYLVIDNLLPFFVGGASGVAHGAHIGGFVAGSALAWVLAKTVGERAGWTTSVAPSSAGWSPLRGRRRGRVVPWPPARVEVKNTAADELHRAVREHRMADALRAFQRVASKRGQRADPQDVFDLGRWLLEQEQGDAAITMFRYYVVHYPRGAQLNQVHLALGVLWQRKARLFAAREHFLAAIDLSPPDSPVVAQARAALATFSD